MLYREFGKTGWKVSAIGMGTWNIGNQWGELDDATAWATVRAAVQSGMNLFDTAESYGIPNGLSEERLGAALAGIRHQVYVVSKVGHWGERTGQGVPKTTVDMIRLCAHASLHRLRTDWMDVLLCHEGTIQDPSVYLEAFEHDIAQVEKLKTVLEPGEQMVTAALRYVISPPAAPVAIPGAKSPEQARMNAAAGDRALSEEEMNRLLAALG